jgi:hypothetical protein
MALAGVASMGYSALGSIVDSPGSFVLRSRGNITLDGAVTTGGAVGALGSFTQGYGSNVSGAVEMGTAHSWTDPAISTWTAPGGSAIDLGWSQTRSLTAGSYGAFTSNSSTVLNLGPGSYTFSSFQLGWSGRVVADTSAGDVYMYVHGSLNAADATRFEANGPGTLYLITHGDVSFGYQANVEAAVYSGGSLSFGAGNQLTGLGYASGNISAGYGSNFTFATVPGPGALALLPIAAGFAVGGRRKRSHK